MIIRIIIYDNNLQKKYNCYYMTRKNPEFKNLLKDVQEDFNDENN